MYDRGWKLADAIEQTRLIETVAKSLGLHVALTGSVLFTGQSTKDMDLVVYRHDNASVSMADVDRLVAALGYLRVGDKRLFAGYKDGPRFVVVARMAPGKRIDFIGT